jgi:hypothetical protein
MKTKMRILLGFLFALLLLGGTMNGVAQTSQTADQTVCMGIQPYKVDASLLPNPTYNWTISGGGTIASGNGTVEITVNWTTVGGPYTLSVTTTSNGCTSDPQSVSVTVVASPVGPTLAAQVPALANVCEGTNVSATFTAGSGGVGCSDAYQYRFDGTGVWTAYTPGTDLSTTGHTLVEIQGQRSGCTTGSGCNGTEWVTLATWGVTAPPTANISYSGSPWCTSAAAQTVTLTGTNAYTGGVFSSTTGLTINGSTGEITPSTSAAGTYLVTYTIAAAGGCAQVTATTSVTITALPTASISYSGSPWCTSASAQTVTLTGTNAYTGGTFSSTTGLTIDSSTGEITPSTSTAGTYLVTYTISAAGGCAQVTATASVTITALPTASISYSGLPWCSSATAQTVTLTGTNAYTGGTFSSTTGLAINSSTGEITPSTSTAGTYLVTYTIAAAGGCAQVTATASVTITALPTASISYSGSPWCTSAVAQTVTLTGTNAYTGGIFSSTTGLTLNSSTGEITPSTSAAGTYLVTYTIPPASGCVLVPATTSITINPKPTTSAIWHN